jgi:hexosaminidase
MKCAMNGIKTITTLLCLLAAPFAYADHNVLLPATQRIHYGEGSIPLKGIAIQFSSSPSESDRFAADQLRSLLKERTGYEVAIGSDGNQGQQSIKILFDRTGDHDEPLALPGDKGGPDSREAYDITVTTDGVKLHAGSSAGLFYGVQTIGQLLEGERSETVLPIVEVHDWPSIAYRGTMVDMSHGPMPTEKEIELQLSFLSRWKANQYYIYSEDSIELEGYPLLCLGGRLSKEDIRKIVAYGRERHIDVIPNFDLYGHQHDLFRIEQYSGLSDRSHGTEFDPKNPGVAPLLSDWVNQFADLFPSPFVNIGFDETFQIEAETHASGVAAAPAELFVKQLTAVATLFQKRGKTVMAYDDIMVKYPQIIPELPSGIIAVAWYYTSEDPTYKLRLTPLVAHHIPHFVQPGITSYADIAPDYDTTFENIDTFVAAARESGAEGLVNSVWADDAQLLFNMSLPGFAYGAIAPWQSTPIDRANFFTSYARQIYPAAIAPSIASALSNMTTAETDLKKLLGEQTMMGFLGGSLLTPEPQESRTTPRGHQARLHAEQAETALLQAKEGGADPATLNNLMIGSEMLDYAGQKFQTPLDLLGAWAQFGSKHPNSARWWSEWESQVTVYDHSYVVDLMDRIAGMRLAYQAEWMQEYTPYRMGSALGRWDSEYQYWRGVHDRLRHFDDSTHEGDVLPPLDQVIEGIVPATRPRS